MARSTPTLPSQTHQFETVLHDAHGNEILRIGLRTYCITLENGDTEDLSVTDSIETVDGLSWNPTLLRHNPPVLLIACPDCRRHSIFSARRPSHGLCTADNAVRCDSCGVACCPEHIRLCSDEVPRCLSCARWHALKSMFTRLLFQRTEETE